VGLVVRVSPVALVLHLELVAGHRARDAKAGGDLVRKGTDVHDRLLWIDTLGKARLHLAAIDMLHRDRMPAHALHRMQNDKTRAIGEEVGNRGALAFEAHRSVSRTAD